MSALLEPDKMECSGSGQREIKARYCAVRNLVHRRSRRLGWALQHRNVTECPFVPAIRLQRARTMRLREGVKATRTASSTQCLEPRIQRPST